MILVHTLKYLRPHIQDTLNHVFEKYVWDIIKSMLNNLIGKKTEYFTEYLKTNRGMDTMGIYKKSQIYLIQNTSPHRFSSTHLRIIQRNHDLTELSKSNLSNFSDRT